MAISAFENAIASIEGGNSILPKQLLAEYPGIINQTDTNGNTLLHFAAYNCHLDLIRLLVSSGADVNAVTYDDGRTPLFFIISSFNCQSEQCKYEGISFMLQNGAKANIVTQYGYFPLTSAIEDGTFEIVKLLIKYGAIVRTLPGSRSPLLYAIELPDEEIVSYLIEHGADVNETYKNGWTPLHYAVHWKYLGMANLLLTHGADKSVKEINGYTPLDIAVKNQDAEMVELLK